MSYDPVRGARGAAQQVRHVVHGVDSKPASILPSPGRFERNQIYSVAGADAVI